MHISRNQSDVLAPGIWITVLLILGFFGITLRHDNFLSQENLLNIVKQTTPITVMAVGLVFVLSAGEIDLSIGSVVALTSLFAALALRDYGLVAGVAAGLGVGVATGMVNGFFVTMLRLPSFLVTLATLGLVAGETEATEVTLDHSAFPRRP